MRKSLGIGLCFLLVCSMIIPASMGLDVRNTIEQPLSFDNRNILYVGGTGPNNYTTIQSAIDDASDGDTVYVFDDSSPYKENLRIGKSLYFIGENRETTIIDGSGNGKSILRVEHLDPIKHFFISGFTIRNTGYGDPDYPPPGIYLGVINEAIVFDNMVINCKCGIVTGPLESDSCVIEGNIIRFSSHSDNKGIVIAGEGYTIVKNNTIQNANYGIDTDQYIPDYECIISNNNFIDNNFDRGFYWIFSHLEYIENYWDNYNGLDNNGDGIGDTPHMVGEYQIRVFTWIRDWDPSPLMRPFEELRASTNGPYGGFIDTPLDFNGFATGGTPPYSWYWTLGDGNTSTLQNPTNTYTEQGKYTISLTVTDSDDETFTQESFVWIQESNNPPRSPDITGPSNGDKRISHPFIFSLFDSDDSPLFLVVDYNDDYPVLEYGPYESGEEVTLYHEWINTGRYRVKAKVRDVYGEESDWVQFHITIPRTKESYDSFFMRLLDGFPLLMEVLLRLIR